MEHPPTVNKILHHLSFAELEAYVVANWPHDPELDSIAHDQDDGRRITDGYMARLIGVDRATINRWRGQGALSVAQADRAAIGLDTNPSCIWTETWSADIDPQLVLDDSAWEQAQKDRQTQMRKIRKQQRQEQQ